MKHFFTLAACVASLGASAQCVWNSDLVTPAVNINWTDGDLCADGGALVLATPNDGLGDLLLVRTAPDGTELWDKRFATTDPVVQLRARNVLATPDGGALVFGVRLVTGGYTNIFAIKLDANGVKEWARIYMAPQSQWMYAYGDLSPRMAIHPSGGYVLALPGWYGVYVNRLDAQGLPLWTRQYAGNHWYLPLGIVVEPDDELMLAVQTQLAGGIGLDPVLLHILPNGDLDWVAHYSAGADTQTTLMRTANGDYLLNGIGLGTGIMRVTATGAVIWRRHTGVYSFFGNMAELSNGDILAVADQNYFVAEAIRWQANGTLVQAWNSTVGSSSIRGLVGTRSDSLILGWSVTDSQYNNAEPRLLTVPSTGSMGCAFTGATVNPTDPGLPTMITDTVTVYTDTLKTWTLSLLNEVQMNQMDLASTMITGPARPGFQHHIYGQMFNQLGAPTGPINATMTVDPQLSIVSAVPVPSSIVGNTLTWNNLPSLDGFSPTWNGVHVTTLVPAGLAIGTLVTHTMTATPDSLDINMSNNTATVSRTVSNSYDPNEKLVWPADVYDLTTDSILSYTINFQNTGTDTAFTVVVRDTLPNEISVGSFIQGPASHPYTFSLTASGVATWTFNNILLPDSTTNEAMSHGLVSFRIKPDAGLLPGTVISNTADIYFDFNPPIQTPTASVVLTMPTAVPILHADQLLIYPVPVRELLTVELPEAFTPRHMHVTTIDGREVASENLRNASGRVAFPAHDLSPGLYLMTVEGTDGRLATARFVKE